MNERQNDVIRAAKAAIAFSLGLKNAPERVTEAAKRLEVAVAEVSDAEQRQNRARYLRKAPHLSINRAKTILLRKHLGPIAADGREMLAGLPGVEESLRLPRIKDAPAKHLEAAMRVRRVAAEHEQEFINDRKYASDFLEGFDLAVQDLEAAAGVEQGAARMTYTRATQHVKDAITRVRRALEVLDTRMRESFLDDKVLLKLWHRKRRIPPKLGRPKKRKSRTSSHAGA